MKTLAKLLWLMVLALPMLVGLSIGFAVIACKEVLTDDT